MAKRLRLHLCIILLTFVLLPASSETLNQSTMPAETVSNACISVDQMIYFLGGMSLSGSTLASCSAYDTVQGKWLSISDMGMARASAAAAYCNGKIYVFGGRNDQSILNSVEIYDIAQNKWSYGTDMPYAAWELIAEECNGSIYVLGGIQGTGDARKGLNDVYILEPVQGTWSQGPSLPSSRHTAASAVMGDAIYVIGGKEQAGANAQAVDLVSMLDTKAMMWSALQPLPMAIVSAKAAAINGEIYLAGGSSRGSILGSVLKYNANDGWTNAAELQIARFAPSVAAVDGTLYVLGGVTVAPGSSSGMKIASEIESFSFEGLRKP
jgi:N-acetylneuraminic acid mutarotase